MNGAQRSVTPEAFSAGTTAKVSSGYFAFQSCAEAAVALRASAAAPASRIRRLIMGMPLVGLLRMMDRVEGRLGVHAGYLFWSAIRRRRCPAPESLRHRAP